MLLSHLKEVAPRARSWHLWFPAFTIGLLGISRGLDEGLISGIINQKSFKVSFDFEADSEVENSIASMLQAGSIVGSFLAFIVCDWLGRKRTSQLACVLWLIGSAVWWTSVKHAGAPGNLSQLLAGRFLAGLGVGMTPVCAPTYLVEIAPRAIRGLCVAIFAGSVYVGILLGYWVNYGTSLHIANNNPLQWQAPASLNFVVGGIILILAFLIPESPRWLLKVGRRDDAQKSLNWLRNCGDNDPVVNNEFDGICEQLDKEAEARGNRAWYHLFIQMVKTPRNLHILAIGVGIQIFGQFSGGGSMTVFAPKLFGYVGITGSETKLFTTGVFGIVKLVSAMAAAFFLVDLAGRKTAVMTGLSLQAICSLYLCIYLKYNANVDVKTETKAQKMASEAGIAMIFLSGVAWALGVNAVQYLSQTELFSLEVRALGVGFVSIIHFLCQFGSSRSVNPIINSGGPWSLFLFFFLMSLAALAFVFCMMPEVSGYPLEDIKELFESKPWYLVGATQNRPLRSKDTAATGDDVPQLSKANEEQHAPPHYDQDGKDEEEKKDDDAIVTRTTTA